MKKSLQPVDSLPLFEMAQKLSEGGSYEEKQIFLDKLRKGMEKTGRAGMDRALTDGTISEEEWLQWKEQYGVELSDIGPVLQAYYNVKDGYIEEGDSVFVISGLESVNYEMRDIYMEKLGVRVISIKEVLEDMGHVEGAKCFKCQNENKVFREKGYSTVFRCVNCGAIGNAHDFGILREKA